MKLRILQCVSPIVLSACFIAGGTLAAAHAQATQSSSSAPSSSSKHKSKRMKKSSSSATTTAAPAKAAPSKPAASAMAATSKPAATAGSTHGSKMTAQTPPQPGMVWANTDSKVYHKAGSAYYGKTKQGKWMTEQDAAKAGYRAAKN